MRTKSSIMPARVIARSSRLHLFAIEASMALVGLRFMMKKCTLARQPFRFLTPRSIAFQFDLCPRLCICRGSLSEHRV